MVVLSFQNDTCPINIKLLYLWMWVEVQVETSTLLETFYLSLLLVCISHIRNMYIFMHHIDVAYVYLLISLNMFCVVLIWYFLFLQYLDSQHLYGSDYAAMKVAGHELKGSIAYFNCGIPNLHIPMIALVDYMGKYINTPRSHSLPFFLSTLNVLYYTFI